MSLKSVKKQVAVLTLFFVANMLLPSFSYAKEKNSDIASHWAGKQLNKWVETGLINGYKDNTYKPNKPITRSEFISLINRALGLKQIEKVNFIDIIGNEWFAEEFAKAGSVNYISGYEDGSMRPNSPISREEVAAVISRLLVLDINNFDDKNPIKFTDQDDISDWSKDVISSVVKTGVMAGYSDYTFKPKQYITRAEAVITLDRALGKIINTNNLNGPEEGINIIKGNATISSHGSLRNTVIMGNLYLTEGIEEGEVTLDNVTINGKTIIRGGGSDSIYLNNSKIKSAIVNKANGNIRIVASGTTSIERVELSSGGILEEQDLEGAGFNRVIVNSLVPTNSKVQLAGIFNDVEISASEVNLDVISGRINSLQIIDSAVNTSIQVQIAAVINSLELNSAVKVTGDGRVSRAIINAPGTSFEKSPSRIIIEDKSITAEIGNREIRKQDTIDNDSSRNKDNSGGDSRAQDNADEQNNNNSDDGDTEIHNPEEGNTEEESDINEGHDDSEDKGNSEEGDEEVDNPNPDGNTQEENDVNEDNDDSGDSSNSEEGDGEVDNPDPDGNAEDNNENENIKDKESMDEHIHENNDNRDNCDNHGEGNGQIDVNVEDEEVEPEVGQEVEENKQETVEGDIEEIDEQIDNDTEDEEVETEISQEAEENEQEIVEGDITESNETENGELNNIEEVDKVEEISGTESVQEINEDAKNEQVEKNE